MIIKLTKTQQTGVLLLKEKIQRINMDADVFLRECLEENGQHYDPKWKWNDALMQWENAGVDDD